MGLRRQALEAFHRLVHGSRIPAERDLAIEEEIALDFSMALDVEFASDRGDPGARPGQSPFAHDTLRLDDRASGREDEADAAVPAQILAQSRNADAAAGQRVVEIADEQRR